MSFLHGNIVGTGITSKKILFLCVTQLAGGLLFKMVKIFRSYVKYFLIFPRERNCKIMIGLCKEVLMNYQIMFLDRDNKGKLVPAYFSYFLELL